jgi:hypothetical protein
VPPPEPEGYGDLASYEDNVYKRLGWVDKEAISTYAPRPSPDHRVLVCGLPGVYDKLCGSRFHPTFMPADCVLAQLGFAVENVIKM